MNLREGLSALSKSSPYAVTTERKIESPGLDSIKEYLYVETDIERVFKTKIHDLKSSEILFLCGSSGDGKSEILTRYYQNYRESIDFHLDATHSFHPKTTAIETLDGIFSKHKANDNPLAVGINIGMLGNYAEEGSSEHEDIRDSIREFLTTKSAEQSKYIFLDFEAFPKFNLSADIRTSDFLKKILSKITARDEGNPIFNLYENERKAGDLILCSNYQLLSIPEVQEVIIDLLLRARLEKDQFITARALLDFIHTLLAGKGYLFDNLFNESDNELGLKITDFDPCAIRSKNLDLFIIQRQLDLPSESFDFFVKDLQQVGIDCEGNKVSEYSLIRLFFLIKDTEFSNNFHHKFLKDFDDKLIDDYVKIWNLNSHYQGGRTEKAILKSFYKDVVLAAINIYANRNAGSLQKDEFFISDHNGWKLTAELEINADYNAIQNSEKQKIAFFNAHMKVGEKNLDPIPINISLLDLMNRIVRGYRPNKHDKNTIVLLDEIVDQIVEIANESKVLYLHAGSSKIKIKEVDYDDIEVSGI